MSPESTRRSDTGVAVLGAGAVGVRAARELWVAEPWRPRIISRRVRPAPSIVPRTLQWQTVGNYESAIEDLDDTVGHVVIATGESQAALARRAVSAGLNVITTTDDPTETERLLDLDHEARSRDLSVVVGAGFSPGLAGQLVALAAAMLDEISEVHIARTGIGGRACALERLRSARSTTREWRERRWVPAPSGSGRELVWFPEPIGGKDCYRVASGEAQLLVPAFPSLRTVTVKVAMSRKDRLMLPLPVIFATGSDDSVGALRVEVRGTMGARVETVVMAVLDQPALVSAAVITEVLASLRDGRAPKGAGGLAGWPNPEVFMANLHRRGVRAAEFTGVVD